MNPQPSPAPSLEEIAAAFPELVVEAHLGQGGQGSVFLCRRKNGERLVAKIYAVSTDDRRIEREIERLAQVSSPHVVKLLDHGTCVLRGEEVTYCFIEWVDGPDLTHDAAPMNEQEVRRLLCEVAMGIQALWSARAVHRDLKPANILRGSDGRYVIVDLGFAKHLDRSTITKQGYWCGTTGYASPEQASARGGLTCKSDLFSLGLIAYEMALGEHPYGGNQDLVNAAPLVSVPDFSQETNGLLQWLTRPKALDRPRNPEEFLAALKQVMG